MSLPAAAQDAPGAVGGLAKNDEDGAPIPFALVRLVPIDSQRTIRQQGITNAQGRFSFAMVPAGEYRLELLRIGFRPAVTPVFPVRAGELVQQELRGSMVGLALPAIMVYPDGACLNSAEIAKDPYLTAFWEAVRQGVEVRREFEQRYRYSFSLAQQSDVRVPNRPDVRRERVDTIASEPDSVLVREARLRARRAADGYGTGNTLQLPNEKELLDDAFLREHCVVPVVLHGDSATGIEFRQSTKPRKGFGIRGTIWVDPSTHVMQRLALEYLDGKDAFSQVTVDYTDVAAAGARLRLPTYGLFVLRPLRAPRGTTSDGMLSFKYWGFDEVRPR